MAEARPTSYVSPRGGRGPAPTSFRIEAWGATLIVRSPSTMHTARSGIGFQGKTCEPSPLPQTAFQMQHGTHRGIMSEIKGSPRAVDAILGFGDALFGLASLRCRKIKTGQLVLGSVPVCIASQTGATSICWE